MTLRLHTSLLSCGLARDNMGVMFSMSASSTSVHDCARRQLLKWCTARTNRTRCGLISFTPPVSSMESRGSSCARSSLAPPYRLRERLDDGSEVRHTHHRRSKPWNDSSANRQSSSEPKILPEVPLRLPLTTIAPWRDCHEVLV